MIKQKNTKQTVPSLQNLLRKTHILPTALLITSSAFAAKDPSHHIDNAKFRASINHNHHNKTVNTDKHISIHEKPQPHHKITPAILHSTDTLPDYAVNMQDGGLILKETNLLKFQGGSQLNVELTYRSRSFHKGYFGQGWCSSFESALQFQGGGVVRLEDCKTSRPRHYSLNATASAYVNNDDPTDKLMIKMGHYERQIHEKTMSKYNFKGQLTHLKIDHQLWEFKYDTRNLPTYMSLKSGENVRLKWHPLLALVEKIEPHGGPAHIFKYDGFILKKIQNSHGVSSYNYDDLDNLILRSTKNSEVRFEYKKELDQIERIFSNCEETYEFTTANPTKRSALLKKKCLNQQMEITKYEFEYNIKSRIPAQVKVIDIKNPVSGRLSQLTKQTE